MTGTELGTFCGEVNGGASIGSTVLFQFLNLAKAMVEQLRPWMLLRYTDMSKSVTNRNTWQTAIDLSSIARFNRFYGDVPVKLFDGASGIQRFKQVSFEKRLGYARALATNCAQSIRAAAPALRDRSSGRTELGSRRVHNTPHARYRPRPVASRKSSSATKF